MSVLIGADKKNAGFLRRIIANALSDSIGCIVGNPFDVVKIQMMADINSQSKDANQIVSEIFKF